MTWVQEAVACIRASPACVQIGSERYVSLNKGWDISLLSSSKSWVKARTLSLEQTMQLILTLLTHSSMVYMLVYCTVAVLRNIYNLKNLKPLYTITQIFSEDFH